MRILYISLFAWPWCLIIKYILRRRVEGDKILKEWGGEWIIKLREGKSTIKFKYWGSLKFKPFYPELKIELIDSNIIRLKWLINICQLYNYIWRLSWTVQ